MNSIVRITEDIGATYKNVDLFCIKVEKAVQFTAFVEGRSN